MLDDVFGTRAKVRILRSLWRSEGALSGREVARRAGLSHTGALASLDELTSVGVVRRWPQADRSIRFALNEDHALVPAIRAALEGEAGMSLRLVEFLTVHAGEAVSIVVFGSIARGDDTIESDVDVLVVVPDGVDADELNEVFAGLDSASR